MVTDIRKETFGQEVLEATGPVVVDFWAPWCGYCRRLAPVLERVAEQFEGRARFVKVDVDVCPELSERYEIEVIPTLVLFRGGEAAASVVNPGSQAALTDWLEAQGL